VLQDALSMSEGRKAEMRYLAENNIINNFSLQAMQMQTLAVYQELFA